jgi:hypothetical protein
MHRKLKAIEKRIGQLHVDIHNGVGNQVADHAEIQELGQKKEKLLQV